MQPTTAPNCKICLHRESCLYNALDESSKTEWIALRKARVYSKGTSVFLEGDMPHGVHIVCEGKVKIFKTTKMGRILTTKVLPAGSVFGHRSFLAEETYSAGAEAFSDSVVSKIEEKSFMGFLKRHWPATRLLLKQLSRGVREGEDKAREIAFSTARSRLAQTLLSMTKRAGAVGIVTVARKELAQIAGIAPETCVRIIRKFESEGILKRKSRKMIVISNPSRLESISGGSFVASQ